MILGALEAGGTKMVCAIGEENGTVLDRISLPTTTPEETMPKIVDYFNEKNIAALGIGCFGPIDLQRESVTYGYITSTPKLAWRNYDIVGNLKRALQVPIGFDTDVNASLLGEVTWGIAKGLKNAMYITIGTGIGAGIMVEGKLLHGNLHPEAGHIPMRPHESDVQRGFHGVCPYHTNCFEGLATGPSIEKRWGKKGASLADEQKVWELEAHYIAEALYTYILTLAPQIIILGGGVMHQKQLFSMIRENVAKLNAGYICTKELNDLEHYIVPCSLQDNQGVMGAMKLGWMEHSMEKCE